MRDEIVMYMIILMVIIIIIFNITLFVTAKNSRVIVRRWWWYASWFVAAVLYGFTRAKITGMDSEEAIGKSLGFALFISVVLGILIDSILSSGDSRHDSKIKNPGATEPQKSTKATKNNL